MRTQREDRLRSQPISVAPSKMARRSPRLKPPGREPPLLQTIWDMRMMRGRVQPSAVLRDLQPQAAERHKTSSRAYVSSPESRLIDESTHPVERVQHCPKVRVH